MPRSARVSSKPRRRSAGVRSAPSLLVLQLDSEKLVADGLDMTPFATAVSLFSNAASVEIVPATTQADLLATLANLHGQRFDVVTAIGHSNAAGIALTSDSPLSTWSSFGAYLKPFSPKKLVLAACQAGRAFPVGDLFEAIPSVRRIFASPVNASRLQAQVMIGLIPHLLDSTIPSGDLIQTVQGALLLLQGKQLWQWKRTDWERNRGDIVSPFLLDAVADLGDAFLRRLRRRS